VNGLSSPIEPGLNDVIIAIRQLRPFDNCGKHVILCLAQLCFQLHPHSRHVHCTCQGMCCIFLTVLVGCIILCSSRTLPDCAWFVCLRPSPARSRLFRFSACSQWIRCKYLLKETLVTKRIFDYLIASCVVFRLTSLLAGSGHGCLRLVCPPAQVHGAV
jgi:hypothetical protein